MNAQTPVTQDPVENLPQPAELPAHLAGLSDVAYDPSRDPRVAQQEPVADPAPQQQQQQRQDDPDAPVPSARLREEAEKRRSAESQLEELRQRQGQLNDRFAMLQEAIQGQQQGRLDEARQKPLPDPSDDLQGYVEALKERYDSRDQQREEQLAQLTRQQQQAEQIKSIQVRAKADQDQFTARAPDFNQAYSWYRNQQMAELTAMGVDATQAAQHIDMMELQLSAAAQQRGTNTAEVFYNAAVARGWQAPQQQTQQQVAQAQQQLTSPADVTSIAQHPQYAENQGQQVIPPQRAPQQQYQPHGQTLKNINEGMLHSRSLDEAPPSSPATPMSLERFANMSDAEFAGYADQVAQMMRTQMG